MVRLTFTEAIKGYMAWRVPGGDARAARLDARVLAEVRAAFGRSLPDAAPGESTADALRRTFTTGAFQSPEATRTFFSQLADLLLPADLIADLRAVDGRPHLVIDPSPSLAQVPWSSLLVGPERVMLGELADVTLGVPAAVAAQARRAHDGEGALVAMDPRAPGLKPVLGDSGARPRLGLEWLLDGSVGAGSFLFVGHVSAADVELASGESSTLHLSEPVTAGELLRSGWRAPRRVGLVGCGSGTDLRYPEPFGLALTAIMCGAENVAATVWTLPTDAGIAEFAGGDAGAGGMEIAGGDADAGGGPLSALADAIAAAHAGDDPVRDLLDWQAARARAWYADGNPADTPAVWAAPGIFHRG